MIDIPQNEFDMMQAQAIRFARELHQRATPQRVPEQPVTPPPVEAQFQPPKYPPPNEIFGHRNPWTQKQETPFCKGACPIKNLLGFSGNNSKSGDGDMLLLMALLLVLSSDGGDRMLMLALLYIMT
ncbi:MAG: hypothetical protein MJ168_08750 [Clostridia bacterium]|nr:hypothetical protein [Clostridia bacterium]